MTTTTKLGDNATTIGNGSSTASSDKTSKTHAGPCLDDKVLLKEASEEFDASIHTLKSWAREGILKTAQCGTGKPYTASRLEIASMIVQRNIGSNLDKVKLAAMREDTKPSRQSEGSLDADTRPEPGAKAGVASAFKPSSQKHLENGTKKTSSPHSTTKFKRSRKPERRKTYTTRPPRNRAERRQLVATLREAWSFISLEERIKLFREFHADVHTQTQLPS